MSKVIVAEFLTLDGVMEAPEKWQFQFWHDDMGKAVLDSMLEAHGLLLGRVTYEIFAGSWPSETGEMADRINGMPKYVASTTLKEVTWNNSHLLEGDVPQAVRALKEKPGKDLLVVGSGELVNTLLRHDLVDEYELMIHPIVLGSGKHLFGDESESRVLKLADTKTFDTGVVLLTYRRADG
ncbi:MAG TPA: dihydrofolate reductase family protein [Chloroflexia bacterium]|nr:dihydrofolate reductase family protein [Chloroflexia bacterium]